MKNNSFTDATCSLISSFITAFVMNPVDVLRTRIYNAGANSQYKYVHLPKSNIAFSPFQAVIDVILLCYSQKWIRCLV
jgi:hypothetical protein